MIESIHPKWIALIEWCQDHPYCTIEHLDIVNGIPVIITQRKIFTNKTSALVKIKF